MEISIEKYSPIDGDYWLILIDTYLFAKAWEEKDATEIKEALLLYRNLGFKIVELKTLLYNLKELAIREHYTCEDGWYNCPKSNEGTLDDSQGTECNCGTDIHNEKVEKVFDIILKRLAAMP